MKEALRSAQPDTWPARAARYIFFGLLAYMPLHIFLSTWLGTSLDILAPAKVVKEFVLLFGFGLVLSVSVKHPWFKQVLRDKIVWLIAVFAAVHTLLIVSLPNNQEAELLALAYNTRYLVFFLYAVLLAQLYDRAHLVKRSVQIVLATTLLVLMFGLLQQSILPYNFMERVGYSSEAGTLPVFLVDNNPDFIRIFSTQRNPNAYGSYLIIVIMLAVVYLRSVRRVGSRYILVGFLGLALMNLLYTYSRSAWVGLVASVLAIITLLGTQGFYKKLGRDVRAVLVAVTVALALISIGIIYSLRDNITFQNVVFHSSSESVAASSNAVRLSYWRNSVEQIATSPLGDGPGTAGPVSMRTTSPQINENYYLQLGIEVGIAGLMLFLALIAIVFSRLWRSSHKSPIAAALMAGFVGLAVTNMFAHVWIYEAVAYTWWGLAGLVVVVGAKPVMQTKKKAH